MFFFLITHHLQALFNPLEAYWLSGGRAGGQTNWLASNGE